MTHKWDIEIFMIKAKHNLLFPFEYINMCVTLTFFLCI